MVSDIKKKEILTVKEMLDTFNAKIDGFKADMAAIDEKYKALIEQEKKELKQNLSDCKSQVKVWQKLYNGFNAEDITEVLGEAVEEVRSPVETAEEDVVVDPIADDLFSGNGGEPEEEGAEVPEFVPGKDDEDFSEDEEEEQEEEEEAEEKEEDDWEMPQEW